MVERLVISIYAGTVLLYVGTAAWIVRAWTRRRYRHKSPSDLHYIAASIILIVSAGIGVVVASQIVVALGYTGQDGRFNSNSPNVDLSPRATRHEVEIVHIRAHHLGRPSRKRQLEHSDCI